MINTEIIAGEQDYVRFYHGLMYWLDRINENNRPCHYAIRSVVFPVAYTFNFVVPEQCPDFFYDRNAEIPETWTEYDIDGFIDALPDAYSLELETAMIKGLISRIRDHGTGPSGRFFKTQFGKCWMVSARMIAIIGTESLEVLDKESKPMSAEYQPGLRYSTKL